METKQLYKKQLDDNHNEIGQEDFSPVTLIESIYDSESGNRLDQILGLVNHWYVPYAGDAIEAYKKFRSNMRHVGTIVSYRDETDTIVTRQYIGASYNDTEWEKIENWIEYSGGGNGGSCNCLIDLNAKAFDDSNLNTLPDNPATGPIPQTGGSVTTKHTFIVNISVPSAFSLSSYSINSISLNEQFVGKVGTSESGISNKTYGTTIVGSSYGFPDYIYNTGTPLIEATYSILSLQFNTINLVLNHPSTGKQVTYTASGTFTPVTTHTETVTTGKDAVINTVITCSVDLSSLTIPEPEPDKRITFSYNSSHTGTISDLILPTAVQEVIDAGEELTYADISYYIDYKFDADGSWSTGWGDNGTQISPYIVWSPNWQGSGNEHYYDDDGQGTPSGTETEGEIRLHKITQSGIETHVLISTTNHTFSNTLTGESALSLEPKKIYVDDVEYPFNELSPKTYDESINIRFVYEIPWNQDLSDIPVYEQRSISLEDETTEENTISDGNKATI